jgi:hypothetical protein
VLLLLRKRSRDEILPDAEELTAGRLIDIVTSLLAGFPHSAAIRG